jgi:ectoine hydroxylase
VTRCLPPVDPFLALDYFSTNQDYGTWKRDEEKPKPRVMNIAVFLDDVTAANGPLLFIPGCYKSGVVEVGHDLEMTSHPLWTLGRDKVTELAEHRGCVAATGSAGSMLMFSSLLVHASPPNISPFGRTIVYLSLCYVDNHIRTFNCEEWIAHREFDPIEALEESCLMELIAY